MAANPLRGYRRLPGSSRSYRTPTGETISRRAYDNLRAQAAGWRNRNELERFRWSMGGSNWLVDIHTAQGRAPTFSEYRDLFRVKRARERLRAKYGPGSNSELDPLDKRLTAPGGPLARILDAAGKRPLSGRVVGDTP